jgi:hypothetical protein
MIKIEKKTLSKNSIIIKRLIPKTFIYPKRFEIKNQNDRFRNFIFFNSDLCFEINICLKNGYFKQLEQITGLNLNNYKNDFKKFIFDIKNIKTEFFKKFCYVINNFYYKPKLLDLKIKMLIEKINKFRYNKFMKKKYNTIVKIIKKNNICEDVWKFIFEYLSSEDFYDKAKGCGYCKKMNKTIDIYLTHTKKDCKFFNKRLQCSKCNKIKYIHENVYTSHTTQNCNLVYKKCNICFDLKKNSIKKKLMMIYELTDRDLLNIKYYNHNTDECYYKDMVTKTRNNGFVWKFDYDSYDDYDYLL